MAVTERQQLETLRREKKTLTDALASVQDKIQQASSKQTQLRSEIERLSEREEEVSSCNVSKYIADEQTSEKVTSLSTQADEIKTEIDRAQEERIRIRQKETEINERLQDVFNKLLQAGVDKSESQREAKLKETLSNLKRVFPGTHLQLFVSG
jgi:structural maintenance of chromosome 1